MRKSAASNDVVTVMQCWACDNMKNYPGFRVRITKDLFNKQLNELYIQLEVTSKNTSFVKLKLDSRFIFVCVPSPPEPLKSFIVCFVYSWRQERNQ